MTNVSYAQNYEDVMLLRALSGVPRGFYIDVGAQDPVNDSVTKAFYERGWHGINIEPVSHWFQRLMADRPHDINLQLAVSDAPGELHLFEVMDSGLSTTDPEFAQRHAQAGFRILESDVDCVTLDHICEAHEVGDVHFLKIDCEGAEAAALRGISLDRIRPWIILLEATEPNSQKPAYTEWEPLLTLREYQFAYADGLNRFYVATEHKELLEAFAYPPNIFDKFVRAPEAIAHDRLSDLQSRLAIATDAQHMAALRAENERREAALIELRRTLEDRDALILQITERVRHSDDEVLRLQNEAGFDVSEIGRLRQEVATADREIGRLHYAVADRDQEIGQLNATLQVVYRSTSWRITALLRAVRRIPSLRHRWRHVIYRLLRGPAHRARPLLRDLVQSSWLRSSVVAVMGRDSRVIKKARLFLFGAPPSAQVQAQTAILPESPLTRSAMVVLAVIEQVRKQN